MRGTEDKIPVTNQIAVKSVHLPGKLHSDPADRIIVATAIIQESTKKYLGGAGDE